MYGVRVAVDAILVSPTDVERYKDSHALVIKRHCKKEEWCMNPLNVFRRMIHANG